MDEGQNRDSAYETRTVLRTPLPTRAWHWLNAICIFFLLASGLQIFNAHAELYIGQAADFRHPALAMRAFHDGAGLRGETEVLGQRFDTTGVLGASKGPHGVWQSRGFPGWLTLPSGRDLSSGRHWHFFFAWLFAAGGLAYVLQLLIGGRFRRALLPTTTDLRAIPRSVVDHILFRHPHGLEALRFNVLQKLAYLTVLLILLPAMVLTGLTMSPGMDAAAPWLLLLFGGRQTARTVHFLCAGGIVLFLAIHLFEVVAAGPVNEMRSIITGRFRVKVPVTPEPAPGAAE